MAASDVRWRNLRRWLANNFAPDAEEIGARITEPLGRYVCVAYIDYAAVPIVYTHDDPRALAAALQDSLTVGPSVHVETFGFDTASGRRIDWQLRLTLERP